MILSDKDPIVAIATAAGRGGIGIVRVSFDKRLDRQMQTVLFDETTILRPRYAHLLPVKDMNNHILDRAIVIFFPGPKSYTGESVIEIQAHGGPVLMNMLLESILVKASDLGIRLAEPGEFTKRAYLNGQMDLAQAEAVADLIDAVSESAVQAAGRSLQGEFSKAVHEIADEVNELRAYVEATLDFPEEEIDNLQATHIFSRVSSVHLALKNVIQNAKQGSVLREGITIAIVGSPNVGKSSLLNALAKQEVAIVTDVPGTTRDKIEHWVNINGIPVKMVDTAGIRETKDIVESKGIERTLAEIRKADVVLHLTDASGLIADDESVLSRVMQEARPGIPLVNVRNKTDLLQLPRKGEEFFISAKTGEGLRELKDHLIKVVGMVSSTDGLFMARERHLVCLKRAFEHIGHAIDMGSDISMIDLLAEELRLAGRDLGDILGETTSDDILGIIFGKFCIGK